MTYEYLDHLMLSLLPLLWNCFKDSKFRVSKPEFILYRNVLQFQYQNYMRF